MLSNRPPPSRKSPDFPRTPSIKTKVLTYSESVASELSTYIVKRVLSYYQPSEVIEVTTRNSTLANETMNNINRSQQPPARYLRPRRVRDCFIRTVVKRR
ncbi:unnamed protein product [Macrosiphum euphorbiae]|uniref:Uncharacterized protein n=1 Tax=Macrosiphum euphorbiae TaxID=13131 RepID=A0AAV0WF89_9HEMI|nr:unnamed protein product [Macrosiphum euphorbiae]